jgi:gliding motility-associated lipoprotein GldD
MRNTGAHWPLSGWWMLILMFTWCCSKTYAPKPKGFNRIDLPPHLYQMAPDSLPYICEISRYARVLRDSSWMEMNRIRQTIQHDFRPVKEKFWIDLNYDTLSANIEITYKEIDNRRDLLKEYFADAFRLTNEHQVKASAIDEIVFLNPNGLAVSFIELRGEVPTPVQFITTDSTRNFLRGALYFKTATMNDSLSPVIQYIKTDILHLLNTLQWK